VPHSGAGGIYQWGRGAELNNIGAPKNTGDQGEKKKDVLQSRSEFNKYAGEKKPE